jgi:two-component system chemotaxis sensor kinase CheA
VVKPIGGLLVQLGLYSGATVLGDGGVVLILDLRGILKAASLPPIDRDAVAPATLPPEEAARSDRYLVCTTRAGRRIAVPLAQVVRLEQYRAADLEPLGSRLVVRRGDAFTPVVDADALLGGGPSSPGERVQLVVLDDRTSRLGLAVGGILDVVTAETELQPDLAAAGIAGSLALGGLATEVLDLATAVSLGHSA